MIALHRLTHPDQPFYLNEDSILTLEATPDTVISLSNGSKLLVMETPEEIARRISTWRASILRQAAVTDAVVALSQR